VLRERGEESMESGYELGVGRVVMVVVAAEEREGKGGWGSGG
jgi:hypothetical protein